MQGLAGAGAGALLGALFSLINSLIRFGDVALTSLRWADAGQSVLFAVSVGFILSLVGVMYPAIVAARMQPVEAMRTEQ